MKFIKKIIGYNSCLVHIIFVVLFLYSMRSDFWAAVMLLLSAIRILLLIRGYEKRYKDDIDKKIMAMPIWQRYGFSSEESYLADLEKKERKREQQRYLAKSYKKRVDTSVFRRNLTSLEDLYGLTPVEFEQWVKRNVFEYEGWDVSETSLTADGGIDLVLVRDGEHSIAQCKRFRKTVGEPLLRDFYGTMMSEGVSKGYFVTTGLFSLPAMRFAEDKPIELIDRRILAQKYL